MKNGKKLRQPISRGVANVPVIMQMEALECGAACLAMVLAYYCLLYTSSRSGIAGMSGIRRMMRCANLPIILV